MLSCLSLSLWRTRFSRATYAFRQNPDSDFEGFDGEHPPPRAGGARTAADKEVALLEHRLSGQIKGATMVSVAGCGVGTLTVLLAVGDLAVILLALQFWAVGAGLVLITAAFFAHGTVKSIRLQEIHAEWDAERARAEQRRSLA